MTRQIRGHGDGTISHRKDGRWQIRVTDPVTGKRSTAYAKTQADARRTLRQMLARKESGEVTLDTAVTVREYAATWLDDVAGRRRAESTVREYRRRFDSYILPAIGKVRLNRLSVMQVELMLDGLATAHLSRSTIQGVRNALSALLADAVKSHKLRSNVAVSARLPDTPSPQRLSHATVDEVTALLRTAGDSEMGRLLTVLAYTGCRIGEALGMRWDDLVLDEHRWMLTRTTTMNHAGQIVLGTRTKTGDARLVHLQPAAIAALTTQRSAVASMRLSAGSLWQDHNLVFPSSIGTPQDSRNLRKALAHLKQASGYRHSFHELRHFFATVAASEVPIGPLGKVLGHRRLATTSDLYAHLYAPDAERVTAALDKALSTRASS